MLLWHLKGPAVTSQAWQNRKGGSVQLYLPEALCLLPKDADPLGQLRLPFVISWNFPHSLSIFLWNLGQWSIPNAPWDFHLDLLTSLGAGKIHRSSPTLPFFPHNKFPEHSASKIHVFSPDLRPKHRSIYPTFSWTSPLGYLICILNSACLNNQISPQICPSNILVFLFLNFCKWHQLSPSGSCQKFRSHPWFFSFPYSPHPLLSPNSINSTILIGLECNHFLSIPTGATLV